MIGIGRNGFAKNFCQIGAGALWNTLLGIVEHVLNEVGEPLLLRFQHIDALQSRIGFFDFCVGLDVG